MPYRIISVNDTNDLVASLRPSNSDLWGTSVKRNWVFRGHADSSWQLLPRIWREKEYLQFIEEMPQIKDVFNHDLTKMSIITGFDHEKYRNSNIERAAISNLIERRLVTNFCSIAERLGLIGFQDWRLYDENFTTWYEDTMLFGIDPRYTKIMTLAQHYGLPTRLIDWTFNPLKALAFSVFNKVDSHICEVVCLNISNLRHISAFNGQDGNVYRVDGDKDTNQFLRSQEGIFTYIPYSIEIIEKINKFPSLEFYSNQFDVISIQFPANLKEKVKRILIQESITNADLMPTLDNCAKLAQDYFALRLEEEHSTIASASAALMRPS